MRVLYLSQYFPPEIGATQTRAYEMAAGLVRAGHHVTVLTELPNHPVGIIPPEFRGKLWQRATLDGIDVLRVWVYASTKKTFARRLAFYLSYLVMATLAGLLLARGKFDLVFATSPPLFVGAAGLAISSIRRMPMVFEVRDLWPESAVQLGELGSSRATRLASWLERRCYERARRIVVVSKGVEKQLFERDVSSERLLFVPNGANTDVYAPQPPDPGLREALGLDAEQFVVMFAGLHGLAQDFETMLEAARLLADRKEIVFVFVGDGPRKKAVVEQAASMQLGNVIFHDAVPDRELPSYLALADVGLHAARRLGIARVTLPVKIFSYLACGLPALVAIEGEAANLVQEASAGLVVPPADPPSMVEAILQLEASPELRKRCGSSGRALVCSEYSRQALAKRLGEALEELLSEEERQTAR